MSAGNTLVNRKRTARIISDILNPFLVGLGALFLISFSSVSSPLSALKWVLVSAALSLLPVFLFIIYLVRAGRLDGIFTEVRRQRTRIYLMAIGCATVGYIVLVLLRAPSVLLASFMAGLVGVIVFMLINLRWKISLHTAFSAAVATVLVVLYGWVAVVGVGLVALVAWAKLETGSHTLAQVVAGALLAVLIVVIVFYPFGLM
jgi:hypothetical protein